MVYWYKHDRLDSVEIAYLVLLPLLIVTSNKLTTIINKSVFWLVFLILVVLRIDKLLFHLQNEFRKIFNFF